MAINAKVSVCIKLCNSAQLAVTVAALKPEINSPVTHRANVDLQVHIGSLILIVDAEDTVALRATVNAYLHWIASIVNIVNVIERM
jgi:tRNA threonylcarbamoyladenosine modification (KEOPS) complex  Pcc1 subunit